MSEPLLKRVLRSREQARGLLEADWDLLVRQARHANLLGRLHHLLNPADVPDRPARHLLSAATMAERQHQSVRHETGLLRDTLLPLGQDLILLKGAAYVMAGLPAATGRVFADLDILVPQRQLAQVESLLLQHGWAGATLDAYDQRYYRRWMHELPPLQHIFRGTALDVHHTILPPTGAEHVDASLLIQASVELPDCPGVRVLAPADMVLHSAAHLFHEGEPDNLLRDLSDLDLLLRHFGARAGFWSDLSERAQQLGLNASLRLALRYVSAQLATPVPAELMRHIGADCSTSWRERVLDVIYGRCLRPLHASCDDAWSPWCRRALYVRAHALRMPLPLLAYHLLHKALWPPATVSADQAPKDPR